MPFRQMPKFNSTPTKMLRIPNPGVGGLNLFDLEYEQEVNQTPYMLNMMYKNGTFSKRYGQEIDGTYEGKIYAIEYFDGKLIVHSGTKIYIDGVETQTGVSQESGIFIKFYQTLYYKCNGTIYEYKYDREQTTPAWVWSVMKPYVPEVFTECQPQSGGTYNRMDDYNLLTLDYACVYNGNGTAKDYFPYGDEDNIIDWEGDPVTEVKIDDEVTTAYTVDKTNKKVVFTTAPASGSDNVSITFRMKQENLKEDRERLLGCKYHENYGANGSSHLFLAGGGDGKIFYSDTYDATYFPENNWIIIGSTEQDVTGFGLQYNVLIAFKPREIYSLYSYQTTSSMVTSEQEDLIGTEAFGSNIVNADMGCDAPHTIQLINNQITWFSSRDGVCTLVSTNISDERNVRVLSRNINNTNNFNVKGLLDYTEDLDKIVSIDFDYKYFLVFPESGMCYVWDYAIAPFTFTSSKATDPKILDWFIFDKFFVKQFIKIEKTLKYITDNEDFETNIIKLNEKLFSDLDFNGDGKEDGINSYYMTPFFQFDNVEYLKTVKNIYVQCRGDTSSIIDMYYYTNESSQKELEPESIIIGGKIWEHFSWENFEWLVLNWANTFRRKCSLKKIQMCAFYFENVDKYDTNGNLIESVAGRDMSISHISLDYQIVKAIK
ncbi:MAG: hypothetical protein KBT03_06905 [Bacteroidales bacterium]|nr:hypothetical protein [Candidatus Scybalousia scybalohippi]